MKVTLLCSDEEHPVNIYLQDYANNIGSQHEIRLIRKRSQLDEGDFLFLISCSEIITARDRTRYKYTLVLHASDLPEGRGWSPHVWQIILGAETLTLSLLEAEDKVDSGRVWCKKHIDVPKHALWNEINSALFQAEIDLMDYAINNADRITPVPQTTLLAPTYFRKRSPKDSVLDCKKSLEDQFDLLRVCDPERFPATFEMYGKRYKLTLEKVND